MQNTWFKNLEKNKIINFLKTYFKEIYKEDIYINLNYKHNSFGQKFIEVETLDKEDDYLKIHMYLGEYFILDPHCNLEKLNENILLEGMEQFQDLNKKWIKFLYENNKSTKINNQTYKEYLEEKFATSLISFYENEMAFVINRYLQNKDGFTEDATIATIKEFKKEYEKELKNLPNLINIFIDNKKEEKIK